MRTIVPIQPVPNQTLQVQLSNQAVTLNVYQFRFALFVDIYANNVRIQGGQIAQNLNRLVRDAYFGFVGDLVFMDTQGSADPVYTGLGTRWILLYDDTGFASNLAF